MFLDLRAWELRLSGVRVKAWTGIMMPLPLQKSFKPSVFRVRSALCRVFALASNVASTPSGGICLASSWLSPGLL